MSVNSIPAVSNGPKLRIQDTLSGERRELEPAASGVTGVYACGPTTYGRIHIGNARPFVVFMLLKRFLEHEGADVRLVINVTDVNDKIYDAAREAGVPSQEWAERMTQAYREDTDRLGLGRPDSEPLATETMGEIIALIEDLVENEHAYQADGDVYFRVAGFEGYGKLSNRKPEDMDQGEEAGTASLKEDPLDFALWKGHKEGEDSSWDSPWGKGRPGWHIECSAMAEVELGPGFAVHGGGADLVFPHHENEIAQSEAARGGPFARIWMHNGMVELDEEKMSKSAGNIFQLSEALDRYGREAVVDYLISGHYRQPLSFSEQALEQAVARNERVRDFFRGAERIHGEPDPRVLQAKEDFIAALSDDFNTPRAMAELYDLVTEGNRRPLQGAHDVMEELLEIVGLGSLAHPDEAAPPDVMRLMLEREVARSEKNFERADEIRDLLSEQGWELRDGPDGVRPVRKNI
ncbi:MAG: cysteine--tRNA ligase [Solirubrobacterales bacterium]